MEKKADSKGKKSAGKRSAGKRSAGKDNTEVLEGTRFTDYDAYLFGSGTHYEIYDKLGSHIAKKKGRKGVVFDVWAPHAAKVYVVGDFNNWMKTDELERVSPMDIGVFEGFVPGAQKGQLYKYLIVTADGRELYKADPYANEAEVRPGTASRITDISGFKWTDEEWMKERAAGDMYKKPMAIYECHPGSFMRHPGRDDEGFYTYREFAAAVTKYVKKMGYTHVELMGICEYPYDGSWGYQVTGYYAPTSRYGGPADFAYLVDHLHKNGIGVILDWVPAHFPKDAHGLADFDGQALYEYADPKKGEHPDWGTKIFDYGKSEVKNFLIGSATLWVEKYHIDGLRVDAVASMLYLDYGKQSGQWVANEYGSNENLEAIEFFKHINTNITGKYPGVMMIAEESTAWPKITGKVEDGGLNFSFKWNMGWMHDFIDYISLDPFFRKNNHNKLTFAMSYNEAEKYILVLSHDEVVHLKCSMLGKMPGDTDEIKLANLRMAYTFFMTHPGKKLLFMGQDFAQGREWSEERELDWWLLGKEIHVQLNDYFRELLKLYRKYPALYELDHEWNGFEWINADDNTRSIFSFIRKSSDGKKCLVCTMNMTPVDRDDYTVGVPVAGSYKLVLNSDEPRFGGTGTFDAKKTYKAIKGECDSMPYHIAFPLKGFSAAIFEFSY